MRTTLSSTVLVTLILLLAACGNDTTAKKGNNGTTDVGLDATTDDSGTAAPDAGTTPDPDTGSADVSAQDSSTPDDLGSDDSGMDTQDATVDAGMDSGMMELPFTWPATPADFAASSQQASYINSLVIPQLGQNGEPECCVDFGARSDNPGTDNALARLSNMLGQFGFDLQAMIDQSLQNGLLVLLLDHRELDGQDDADGFVLSWLRGQFEGGTSANAAAAGNGTFLVTHDSFVGQTGEPVSVFNPAQMQASTMDAGPGTVRLVFPMGSVTLEVPVQETTLKANAQIEVDGVAYDTGEVGGYMLLEDFFGAINDYVAAECSCLGLGQTPLYQQEAGAWSGNCVDNASQVCPDASQQPCRTFAGTDIGNEEFCEFLPAIMEDAADIDVDNSQDGTFEALSIGFEWSAAKGQIVGATSP